MIEKTKEQQETKEQKTVEETKEQKVQINTEYSKEKDVLKQEIIIQNYSGKMLIGILSLIAGILFLIFLLLKLF